MPDTVTSFACSRPSPWHHTVLCVRQRHHEGQHRAEHRGRLHEWQDTPHTVPVELDEHAETWAGLASSGGYDRRQLHPLEAVALVLVIVVLATGYPVAVWTILAGR